MSRFRDVRTRAGEEVLFSAPGARKLTPECIKACAAVARVGDVDCRLIVPTMWRSIGGFRSVVLALYVSSKFYMPPPLPIVIDGALGV